MVKFCEIPLAYSLIGFEDCPPTVRGDMPAHGPEAPVDFGRCGIPATGIDGYVSEGFTDLEW
jgi:hypothetical protein